MAFDRILLIEDDKALRRFLEEALRGWRYNVRPVGTLAEARDLLAQNGYDLILADQMLPDGRMQELLTELQTRPDRPMVIIMTGHASVESAVECMRLGALDYLVKPLSLDQIEVAIQKAETFSRLVQVNRVLSHEYDREVSGELIGNSAPMQQLRDFIAKVARTDATVLIQGESGTGKELIARAIYNQSPRANAPFIRVNCAAIPETLVESEFFGHEKGAFTGALTKREGRFELAHGGTLLLDEISEIPLNLQAKLLRVLQEREFERVGGHRTIKVDVRVIATTNRHLEDAVARGEFRADLYYRLNVMPVHVPPLRERREDIPLLAEHFLKIFARKHGTGAREISPAALALMQQYAWPGNVRELQNAIERAVILCGSNGVIEPVHLGALRPVESPHRPPSPLAVGSAMAGASPVPPTASTPSSGDSDRFPTLSELERDHILAALRRCNDNRTHAARILDISVRTLRNKLKEYGYSRAASREAASARPDSASA
ncbi:MAG: sigma-54 dependent transcriptional regulator [Verrucomicrobiae bacterium]|nr:sigma-54 dependent transcriptional regulator [Verrucomicrobiae bacterium]MDW8343911.1 sigma-54 dependent transcriptional regulator [Verrucomicrobiae bacterium]